MLQFRIVATATWLERCAVLSYSLLLACSRARSPMRPFTDENATNGIRVRETQWGILEILARGVVLHRSVLLQGVQNLCSVVPTHI